MLKKSSNHIQSRLSELLKNTGDMALKRRAGFIVGGLDLHKGDKILDIGCGDGFYLHLLSSLNINLKLIGSDFDKNSLASAKKNLKGKKIPLIRADLMEKLPFRSNTFDKVIMSEVIEHLPDDKKGLSEVYRIIKDGGVLCVTVPNANYPLFWDPINWSLEHLFGTHIKSGFGAGIWNQHERLYNTKQIKLVLKNIGFKISVCRTFTWFCLPFNHYILNLAARKLYGGSMSEKTSQALSKFNKPLQRPVIINYIFHLLNALDRLNDFYSSNKNGVGIYIKAVK